LDGAEPAVHAWRTSSTQGLRSLPSSLMVWVGCVFVIQVTRSMKELSETGALTTGCDKAIGVPLLRAGHGLAPNYLICLDLGFSE
jgi:hypothetical protein